jgi:ketosteroid isomerase-like protein
MTNPTRFSTLTVLALAAVAALQLAPTQASAQTALSPVPKEDCCFSNFRFAGGCRVTPRQGQYCQNILSYLNSLGSAGEAYCGSTNIRGGWTLVDCATGSAAGAIGTMEVREHRAADPGAVPVGSVGRAAGGRPIQSVPTLVEPAELKAVEASVIQVRLERPLDGGNLAAGQLLTGRLEADVVGPDGVVLAPAGTVVSAEVSAARTWDQTEPAGAELRLVGVSTSAAVLFGTAGSAEAETAPALHLTGDKVELTDGSLLTFEVTTLSDQPADMRVLTTATTVWTEAFNTRDAATIAGLSSADGALLPPNGRAIIGRDAIYAYWKDLLADSSTRVEVVNLETVIEGDLGYKAGRFELVDTESSSAVDQGKYIQIWKRSPQGFWELHRDMWNSSLPVTGSGD